MSFIMWLLLQAKALWQTVFISVSKWSTWSKTKGWMIAYKLFQGKPWKQPWVRNQKLFAKCKTRMHSFWFNVPVCFLKKLHWLLTMKCCSSNWNNMHKSYESKSSKSSSLSSSWVLSVLTHWLYLIKSLGE